jgi:hypothetical protein
MATIKFRVITTLRIEEDWTIEIPDVEIELEERIIHERYNATVSQQAESFYEEQLARTPEFLSAFAGDEPALLDTSVEVQYILARNVS